MSISSIGSPNYGAIQQQLQKFKSGQNNIQKDELQNLQNMVGSGSRVGGMVSALLESFSEVDQNNDGVSFDELMKFAQSSIPVGGQKGSRISLNAGGTGLEMFEGMDSEDSVTQTELEEMLEKMKAERQAIPESFKNLLASFHEIDANQDGSLDKKEMMTKMNIESSMMNAQQSHSRINATDMYSKFLTENSGSRNESSIFMSQISRYGGTPGRFSSGKSIGIARV